jgi:myo-inositol-1(or 4)-monophosphatase
MADQAQCGSRLGGSAPAADGDIVMTDTSQLSLSSSPYADQLQAAVQAAQQAGELIRSNFDRSLTITTKKDYNELVTDLDIRSEQTILESLANRFGDYSILSEEKGKIDRPSRRQWVIDPLDGTHNLTLGLPVLGVSIALVDDDEVVAGVISHVMQAHLYVSERGYGATVDNRPVHVSGLTDIAKAKVGHIVSFEEKLKPRALNLVTSLRTTCQRLLDTWAPSVEWSLLAHGKLDALVSLGSGPYDRLAGMLIVREAGGLITDFDGHPVNDSHTDYLLASNGTDLHFKILKIIQTLYR